MYARVCCVCVCACVCAGRWWASLESLFHQELRHNFKPLSVQYTSLWIASFWERFLPFEALLSLRIENAPVACWEREGEHWFFPDFTSVEECVWGWTFETPAEGTQKGEVRVVAFAGEPWDLFTVPRLQGWPSETIDFSPGCFSLLLLGTFKTF